MDVTMFWMSLSWQMAKRLGFAMTLDTSAIMRASVQDSVEYPNREPTKNASLPSTGPAGRVDVS